MADLLNARPAKDPDSPAWTSPAYDEAASTWEDCRDVAAGTRAVRAKTTRYLPMNPAEDPADYRERLLGTELFNAYARTVDAMTGMVFQRDPALGPDADAETKREWENIDGAGTHGAVFLKRLYAEGMTTGRAGILVEYPSTAPGLSLAEERRRRLRPYWVPIEAEQVLSWRLARDGAETVFTQLVIREVVEREAGAFGSVSVVRYRVYRRLQGPPDPATGQPTIDRTLYWQVWEHPNNDVRRKPLVVLSGVLRGVEAIPFSPFCPASDGEVWGGRPPLLDLLDVNLAHYRVTGERRYALHLTCSPVPVRTGAGVSEGNGTLAIGPTRGLDLPAGGKFEWVSPDADWDAPSREELKMLEGRAAALGLSMLQHETRDAETAEGQRIHRAGQNATLAGTARTLKDSGERALQFHAAFAKRAAAALEVNNDFEQIVLTPEMIDRYSAMVLAGQLSLDTMWTMLAKGHVLPDDFKPVTEKARLAASGPVGDGDATGGGDDVDEEDDDEDDDENDVEDETERRTAA